jgi:prepilin-type N-terminal cleavage/methylation domain-containing protein
MKTTMETRRNRAGFTLIELLVVVLIIGVLAATAVPQYFKLVEKSKIAEAIHLIDAIRGSQERYVSKYGGYCTGTISTCGGFDMNIPTLKYFNTPTSFAPGSTPPSWKSTLTRNSNTAVYGNYVVSIDVEPGAMPLLTCNQTNCSAELMPSK